MDWVIEAKDIRKSFGAVQALNGISFRMSRGSLFGLIGADGAGKTTLLRILSTLIAADSGCAEILGRDAGSAYENLRPRIGYMPQRFSLYEDLTVEENLRFYGGVFGVTNTEFSERFRRLLEFSRLEAFRTYQSRHLSGGMKQKLALSCALIHKPDLLLLDEPTTGVDPVSRREFWNILHELKELHIDILVSTPYMDEAEHCSDLLLLDHGAAVVGGSPQELLSTFPVNLYRVKLDGTDFPESRDIPLGIESGYPSDGYFYLASSLSLEEVTVLVKPVFREFRPLEQVKPRIKDLFLHYFLQRKTKGNEIIS